MNKIIIELSTEDRARLDRIAELLEAQAGGKVKTASKPEIEPMAAKKEEPKALEQAQLGEMPAPELEPMTDEELTEAFDAAYGPEEVKKAEPAPEVKLEDIQRLVVKLATSGKKNEARDIVKAYAPSVTQLPADKYGEVYEKLQAIGG